MGFDVRLYLVYTDKYLWYDVIDTFGKNKQVRATYIKDWCLIIDLISDLWTKYTAKINLWIITANKRNGWKKCIRNKNYYSEKSEIVKFWECMAYKDLFKLAIS